ncbi:hypothetical protein CF595_05135 [Gallibacterium anatis]|nr:hypothetical protein CF595_05135 [Gallibacterium anatis]
MTGNLVIDTADALLKGKRSGENKYAVGLRNSTSNDIVLVNYTDNTALELLANSVCLNKTIVAPGMILDGSDWTGVNLKNSSDRYVRLEGNPHTAESMLNIIYREANGTNINTVYLRKKGGTIALLEDACPAGLVAYFASAKAPTGWLKANGAAVSRTTYAALFAVIGTTFGAGDERTTFNLPDLRGEFIRGLDEGRAIDISRTLGSQQGDAMRNITGSFDIRGVYNANGSPHGTVVVRTNGIIKSTPGSAWDSISRLSGSSNTTTVTIDAARSVPTANENRPRNIALLACIKY